MKSPSWYPKLLVTITIPLGAFAWLGPATALAKVPPSGVWGSAADMNTARDFAAAATFAEGYVLLVGGKNFENTPLASVEVYDPLLGEWATGGELNEPRVFPAAVALPGGYILIVGGHNNTNGYLDTSEVFDVYNGEIKSGPPMLQTREGPVGATLPDGEALVAGGEDAAEEVVASAEIYNPQSEEWRAVAPMRVPRERAVAVTLPDGEVLVAGGENETSGPLRTTEFYNPVTNSWTAGPEMLEGREGAAAALLGNGEVLVAGGEGESGILSSAEAYNPATGSWHEVEEMGEAREGASAASLPNGGAVVAGGDRVSFLPTASAEIYYPPAQARIVGGGLGDVPVGESSHQDSLLVTNVGSQPLTLWGSSIGGPNAAAFSVPDSNCPGRTLQFGQTCTVDVVFKPTSAGPETGQLTLETNSPLPATATLAGEGVPVPASSSASTAGPTGATGPAGQPGAVELITCRLTSVGAGKHRKLQQSCTTGAKNHSIRFTGEGQKLAAIISRGGHIYAEGFTFAKRSSKVMTLAVSPLRAIAKGSYTLTVKNDTRAYRQTISFG